MIGTQMRRSIFVLLAMVIVLSIAVNSIAALGCIVVSVDTSVNGIEVKYFSQFFAPQQFKIVVENISGQTYPTTLSVYVWMPNGSIVELGRFLGKNGVVSIKIAKIVSFLKEWYRYLVSHGNDPRLVKPGIIVLGSVHTPQGIYSVIKGIPLDIIKILKGLSVEIRIVEKLLPNNVLIPMAEIEELARLTKTMTKTNTFIKGTPTNRSTNNETVMPSLFSWSFEAREVMDYCGSIYDPKTVTIVFYCFVWKLDKIYASALNKGLPLVVVYVYDLVGGKYVKRINDILLREYFEAEESKGVEVAFGIVASIKKSSGEVSYSIPGFTMKLGGDRHVWLNYYKTFFEGIDFDDEAILAIGMEGDLAFVKYKLQYCGSTGARWVCLDTNEEVSMTLARPIIKDNRIVPWTEVDTHPNDGIGTAEKAFEYLRSNWKWSNSHIDYGGIYVDLITVSNEIKIHPLFSTSIAVLPIVLSEVPEASPFVAIASASVGLTGKKAVKMMLLCDISIRSSYATNTYVWANYFYSPVQFDYKGGKYYIGSLYVDALIGST